MPGAIERACCVMSRSSHPSHSIVVVALALVLTGCAATSPAPREGRRAAPSATLCTQFETARKRAQYQTHYQRAATDSERMIREHKSLPANTLALAPFYRVRLTSAEAYACTHLAIHKELHLLRGSAELAIEEEREIFAADGTRIAVRKEDLSAQLRTSGVYRATFSLPLPDKTPPGRYHMITRLVLRTHGGGTIVLADASTGFTVVARVPAVNR